MFRVVEPPESVLQLGHVGLHLFEAAVNIASLLFDVGRRPLAEEEYVLDRYPGAVVGPEEADVCLVLRVDPHYLARPEGETWGIRTIN